MNLSNSTERIKLELKKQNEMKIVQLTQSLQQKKTEQKQLQEQLTQAQNIQEIQLYTARLQRAERSISSISSRLKNLGVTEKRGRPKKEASERYQDQRKKFTAHLQPETVEYLKTLKADGIISNISAFLDDLVAEYQKKEQLA
ncbi:hypothetical protein [Ureibacillus endophyticus]|uniref:Uncharacterized protein n=1 Tax=Ureibacillus endophyticus TaxID=1978490 RepID=A0A494YRP3_9BACL|nr:hypothetical protein [Lysinibacillus endophyticus]RKQ12139.1 hypothetical protein D8M03_17180 [Lysinibacillus endophyticus]